MAESNKTFTLRGAPLLLAVLVFMWLPSFAAGLVCGILVAP